AQPSPRSPSRLRMPRLIRWIEKRKERFMSCRIAAPLVSFLIVAWFLYPARHSPADEASSAIGKKSSDFKLPDTRGRKISLSDFQDKKAVVVAFIGTECPINNAFMPRLVDLEREFGPRG